MKLMNGKPTNIEVVLPRSGTGINNVKKRLELLYKNKYELEINDEPDVFVVNLNLELTESRRELATLQETAIISYA